MPNRIVHFEIHVEDMDRATRFYGNVFGWEFEKWPGEVPYTLIKTGPDSEPGINGAFTTRRGIINGDSVIAYVCTIDVSNIDETLAKVSAEGGTEALPKMAVTGIGWLAYSKDTEGNIFGMMQADTSAVYSE